MAEDKTTTFDHLMNFMTAYVQNNQVNPQDLPNVFERVKNVVFNVAGETGTAVAPSGAAMTTAAAEQAPARRGRKPRALVVGEVAQETAGESAGAEAGEERSQEALPFLAVVGSEPVQKRGPGRPKKNPEVSYPAAATGEGQQGYKFAHISRTPFNNMDPEDAIKPDSIINLIDGVEQTFIKRALATKYGMTPEEYRAHFGLRPDYPVVAPNYAKKRQEIMNKTIANQRAKAEDVSAEKVSEEASAPRRRGRPPKAASAPKANEAKTVKRGRRPKSDEAKAA